jgi:hypothetical protein
MTTVVEVPRKKHRGRTALIVLLVIVVVLVAAFFIGDYFAKKYATNYVRDQIASSLGLPSTAPVTVNLGSGSILLQAATGHIDDVNVTVNPIALDGLTGSATLVAHGVPLYQTDPVQSLQVKVFVPTSTVATAISRVPSLAALKPTVKLSGNHVNVTGTIYIFGFPQGIGATLTPKVTAGEPSFTIDTATFDLARVRYFALHRERSAESLHSHRRDDFRPVHRFDVYRQRRRTELRRALAKGHVPRELEPVPLGTIERAYGFVRTSFFGLREVLRRVS